MSWTDERVELLKKMWTEGQSASQIAKELGGVTRNAVIGKVHRLGLSNRSGGGGAAAAPAASAAPKAEAKPKAKAARAKSPADKPVAQQHGAKLPEVIDRDTALGHHTETLAGWQHRLHDILQEQTASGAPS